MFRRQSPRGSLIVRIALGASLVIAGACLAYNNFSYMFLNELVEFRYNLLSLLGVLLGVFLVACSIPLIFLQDDRQ